jgi:hypothetical protein
MVQIADSMMWAVTVNHKYIGVCPMDAQYGMDTAQVFIKKAVKDKVISEADTGWPHVTTYKALKEGDPIPEVKMPIIPKTRTKRAIIKTKTKKVGKRVSKT